MHNDRGLGCHFQAPSADDMDAGLIIQNVELPESVNWFSKLDRVRDQGATESCVGHAIANAMYIRSSIMGLSGIHYPSPAAIWALGRAAALPRADIPLENVGMMPRVAVNAVQTWGVCSEADMPLDLSQLSQRPRWTAMAKGIGHELRAAYWIQSSGQQRVFDVMKALANGMPVIVCASVDKSLEEAGLSPVPAPSGLSRGNHAMTIVGYVNDGGDVSFRVANSWGAGWADGGCCWFSAARLCDPSTFGLGVVQTVAG